MKHRTSRILAVMIFGIGIAGLSIMQAQEPKTGKLKIKVKPSQAYTFVDQEAIGPGGRSVKLGEGMHRVTVANYGYMPFQQDVTIQAKDTTALDVSLQPSGPDVSGPWGRMQFEVGFWKAGDYAILLNGKSPGYFAGHLDEFNNNNGPNQELVVPPGKYDVTVTRKGKTAWSGEVSVMADQRTIVDISNGKQKVKEWPQGKDIGAMPRFKAKTASATVVIAPVNGMISAAPSNIKCGQPTTVQWAAMETVDNDISGMSPVPANGQTTVTPLKTTAYDFSGVGPGGRFTTSTSVNVDPTVVAQLSTSQPEVSYRKVGDNVVSTDTVSLNWTTENATTVSLDPVGPVSLSGSHTIEIAPMLTNSGPIPETLSYQLRASNQCGGSETRTVSVRVRGSVEPTPTIPTPTVSLRSIYFPTGYPTAAAPTVGLVSSQEQELTNIAAEFMKYLEYDANAKLSVQGYADVRGPAAVNDALSERRTRAVKDFLVGKGVPESKVEIGGYYGNKRQLERNVVADLDSSNPTTPPEKHAKESTTSWLAHNRRVDILFLPKNEESVKSYPYSASDSDVLWQRQKPAPDAVK